MTYTLPKKHKVYATTMTYTFKFILEMERIIMQNSTKKETLKRREIPYESESLKGGIFNKSELTQYGLSDDEITVILDYQALLPVLQDTNNTQTVNARDLFSQLDNGWKFTDWIENRIEFYQLIQDVDFITISRKYEIEGFTTSKTIFDYILTLDCAKQLAMVERTDIGALTRRYFIIIEKAFANRIKWNKSRKKTLINCKELRGALIMK